MGWLLWSLQTTVSLWECRPGGVEHARQAREADRDGGMPRP
jgi:hypothetical protein